MGILILFVLAVGAGTIVCFIWKGIVAFWRKADPSRIGSDQQRYASDYRRDDEDNLWSPKFSGKFMSLSDWSVGRWW